MKAKILFLALLVFLAPSALHASTWAEKPGYWGKTGGKFRYGLKHSLFSWTFLWTEANEPDYNYPWQGMSVGFGKLCVYTAGGLIQLATFPVPVDFPDMGIGLHIPNARCPNRHENTAPPPVKKTEEKLPA